MQGMAKLLQIISKSENTSLLKEATWLCLNMCSVPGDMAVEMDNSLNLIFELCTVFTLTNTRLKHLTH